MKYISLVIWALFVMKSFAQTQIGVDIDGELAGDLSGQSVAISGDGNTVAIGARYNDGNGTDAGHVRVYKWIVSKWAQLGFDINGEAAGDFSGFALAISSDGSIVSIGAYLNDGNGSNSGHVRVYKWSGTMWTQLGVDIDGEKIGDWSGYAVSMSSNGSILAIGAISNDASGTDAGHVKVYKWVDTAWFQLGADINGEAAEDWFGSSVSLSSDGSILAVGASGNDGNDLYSGSVRVYGWSGAEWFQLGDDIDGEAPYDQCGESIALSEDGNILAIGARYNSGNGQAAGHVRVYRWADTAWFQLGSDIDGEAAVDLSGQSVSMSKDGSILAIGANSNDGNGPLAGQVRVYRWADTAWFQLGADIDGEAAGDFSGWSVSISSDGSILAIGAHGNDGSDANAGHVRVYGLSNLLNIKPKEGVNYCNIYPNPSNGQFTLETVGALKGSVFSIYNLVGKKVKSGIIQSENIQINLENLTDGSYILRIMDQNISPLRIVKW